MNLENAKIKREKFRGKYYMTLRVDNKVVQRRRWGFRTSSPVVRKRSITFKNDRVTKRGAVDLYKKQKSILPETERTVLSNMTETTQYGIRKKIGKTSYQVVVTGKLKNGTVISATSQTYPSDYPISRAREEAENNFYERLAEHNGVRYDSDEGKKFKDQIVSKRWGIKQYSRR